jgi:pSer/pThr/pTyr-binding forkhead associated (FHA) protein
MYKYSCRECQIRERCIDESDTAIRAKEMIRNAFAARTDTLSTWGALHKNCLLVKADEERERRAKEGSLLARRLREARAVKEQSDEAPAEETSQPASQTGSISKETLPPPKATATIISDPSHSSPVSPSPPLQIEAPASEASPASSSMLDVRAPETAQLDQQLAVRRSGQYWLIVTNSQRRISLPITGEMILGRFDPRVTDPLDVDLTYEDQVTLTVSRRHAQIVGVNGRHAIEDLGSSNGVFVNGKRITSTRTHLLQPDDQLALGGLQMRYETMPADILDTFPSKTSQVRHFLLITYTGRKVEIASSNNILIGRSDPAAHFVPAIDLSQERGVATYVSRRHVSITWSNNRPYLKDLQSSFGTRLNGEALRPNHVVPLNPGDHISLGGCVLAYDIKM